MDDTQPALTIYAEYFPEFTPSCFQQDLIEQTVTDMEVWRETLLYWAGNGYRPQSILKMLDYYGNYQKSVSVDDVVRAFSDKDARLVEIATLQVLMTSTQPIKSVNYFRPAIDEIYGGLERVRERELHVSSGTIDAVLARRRQQYEKSRQILSTN